MTFILLFFCIVAASLFSAYSLSPASKARKKVKGAVAPLQSLDKEVDEQGQLLENAVSRTASSYIAEIRAVRLREISLDEMKRHGSGMRLQALRDAGIGIWRTSRGGVQAGWSKYAVSAPNRPA